MLYVLDTYDREDEHKSHIIWETARSFVGSPEICGKLHCYMRFGAKKYTIPEGVTALNFLSFVDTEEEMFECDATGLELPASLTKIEDSALLFGNFTHIRISSGNQAFAVKKGGLYSADGKRLIYILTNPKSEVFHIAEGTEQVDAGALFWDGSIVFPNSVKKIADEGIYRNPNLRLHMMMSPPPSFQKLIVQKGSYAERFAKRMGYPYEVIKA